MYIHSLHVYIIIVIVIGEKSKTTIVESFRMMREGPVTFASLSIYLDLKL